LITPTGEAATPGRPWFLVIVAGAILVALAVLAVIHLSTVEPRVAPGDLPGILLGESGDRIERLVVRELGLPRLILALLSGAALGQFNDKGYLMPMFMALASLANIERLVELKNKRGAR